MLPFGTSPVTVSTPYLGKDWLMIRSVSKLPCVNKNV